MQQLFRDARNKQVSLRYFIFVLLSCNRKTSKCMFSQEIFCSQLFLNPTVINPILKIIQTDSLEKNVHKIVRKIDFKFSLNNNKKIISSFLGGKMKFFFYIIILLYCVLYYYTKKCPLKCLNYKKYKVPLINEWRSTITWLEKI